MGRQARRTLSKRNSKCLFRFEFKMRYFGHGQLFSGVWSVTIDLSLDGYLVASILNNIDHTLNGRKIPLKMFRE